MKKILLIILVMTTLSSCYTTTYFINGKYQLEETRSTHAPSNINSNNNFYSDDFVTLIPEIVEYQIVLTIINNHNSTIRIPWDDAAYVDNQGSTHRVIHMGVKLVDKEKAQVPTIIPAGARLDDVVVPSDGIELVNGIWINRPLFNNEFSDEESAKNTLERYRTTPYYTKFHLLLPIEIDNKRIEYTLTFRGREFNIQSVEISNPNGSIKPVFAITGIFGIILSVALGILL